MSAFRWRSTIVSCIEYGFLTALRSCMRERSIAKTNKDWLLFFNLLDPTDTKTLLSFSTVNKAWSRVLALPSPTLLGLVGEFHPYLHSNAQCSLELEIYAYMAEQTKIDLTVNALDTLHTETRPMSGCHRDSWGPARFFPQEFVHGSWVSSTSHTRRKYVHFTALSHADHSYNRSRKYVLFKVFTWRAEWPGSLRFTRSCIMGFTVWRLSARLCRSSVI